MAYVTFEYYRDDYLLGEIPAIPEDRFLFWEKKARVEVDAYTFGRLKVNPELVSEEVKDCVCAIAELLYKGNSLAESTLSMGGAGPLASYSNDGESGSFDLSQSIYTVNGMRSETKRLIYQYLGNTGLLYAGIYRRECR